MKNLKIQLINFLKGSAVKFALKKFLGSAAAGGFKAWLIKLIVTELFEEIAEPLLKLALRKGHFIYDKIDGEIKLKKIERAKNEEDEDAYTRNIGDV